ncbi:Ig-like domain-containing protein, partial [bacterium]|nr:Ig-like domain-containing protein [bacterium]
MNQIIKTVADFVSSTDFLYPATIIVALLSVAYNVTLFLEYRKVIKKVELAPSKNLLKKILKFLHKILFFTLRHSIIVNVVLGIVVLFLISCIIIPQPKVTYPLDPALGSLNITPEKPLRISFDRPINIKQLKYEMSPPLEGDWKFSNNLAPNTFYFYPKETPDRETRYQISLTQIKNLLGSGGTNFLFSFQAPALPEVISTSPVDGDLGVLPNQEISFELSEEAGESASIEYLIDPPIESEIKNDGKKYTITPKTPLKKGSSYTLAIFRTSQKYNFETKEKKALGEKQEISKTSFKVIDAPGVASYAPTGSGVLIDTSVSVAFRQNMDKAATQG